MAGPPPNPEDVTPQCPTGGLVRGHHRAQADRGAAAADGGAAGRLRAAVAADGGVSGRGTASRMLRTRQAPPRTPSLPCGGTRLAISRSPLVRLAASYARV